MAFTIEEQAAGIIYALCQLVRDERTKRSTVDAALVAVNEQLTAEQALSTELALKVDTSEAKIVELTQSVAESTGRTDAAIAEVRALIELDAADDLKLEEAVTAARELIGVEAEDVANESN